MAGPLCSPFNLLVALAVAVLVVAAAAAAAAFKPLNDNSRKLAKVDFCSPVAASVFVVLFSLPLSKAYFCRASPLLNPNSSDHYY